MFSWCCERAKGARTYRLSSVYGCVMMVRSVPTEARMVRMMCCTMPPLSKNICVTSFWSESAPACGPGLDLGVGAGGLGLRLEVAGGVGGWGLGLGG